MQTITQPSLLLKPFAEQGDKNTLPVTNTDPTEPQRADLTSGFPAIVSLPPDQGGLPPERKDFNALGYLTTSYDWFYQCGGTFTFDPTISTAIGGYPIGARLWYTNADGLSMILRSAIQNNTNNFLTDPSVIGNPGDNKPWVIENFMGIKRDTPLLAFNWFDHQPDNASWLKSDTWSWQSGGVYKSAYDFLVDGYDNGTQKSDLYMQSLTYGSLTNVDGVLSGFGTNNYATPTIPFNPTGSWEIVTRIRTNANRSVAQIPVHPFTANVNMTVATQIKTDGKLYWYASANGTTWGIASDRTGGTVLDMDAVYWIKLSYDLSTTTYKLEISSDGETWSTEDTLVSGTKIYSACACVNLRFGSFSDGRYTNKVDMKETYFSYDGALKWIGAYLLPYTLADNGLKIVSAANAGLVQDVFERGGSAWYYILDKTNVQFKLPRTNHGNLVEKYSDGPNWYRLYSDGWCEQGGNFATAASWAQTTISFQKPFKDTNYSVSIVESANSQGGDSVTLQSKATHSMVVFMYNATGTSCWYACGYTSSVPENKPYTYLYFYVGNTIQNQTEVDVGEIMEELNKKWDSSNMVVATALPDNPQSGVFYFIK